MLQCTLGRRCYSKKNPAWVQKNNYSLFDVTMGYSDGTELCGLVGLYMLSQLSNKYSNSGSI